MLQAAKALLLRLEAAKGQLTTIVAVEVELQRPAVMVSFPTAAQQYRLFAVAALAQQRRPAATGSQKWRHEQMMPQAASRRWRLPAAELYT